MDKMIKAGQLYFAPAIAPRQSKPSASQTTAFDNVLTQKLAEQQQAASLSFSNHAMQRLQQRGISLNQEDIQKLMNAVDNARHKGARESLVLMNNVAYIVSVQNKTVITAIDSQSADNHVFTNIDSAVIV
ncbi:TIGR02530 family flagellar biosynthesis protein [Aneurinibacillus terranovensis]|uniref:TIGR02530 family flagellar biosynthesis protein n=1 Tax=Aneurinibacillus terranovensis TaxID=278991 RepID=UPI0004286363|nr:TIGR02530 family flagellar biosynthesis protein [Aneurinibacillus terranovensis]